MRRLPADGAPPAEDRDLRLRTRAYTIASTSLLAVSVLFTVLGFALGRPLVTISSAILFGAAVVGIAVGYRRNRRLDRALRLLLVAGMAYVTVGHILLGGLAASGGALAWGLVAPILALLLFDAASALRWLAAYVVIVVAVVVLDPLIVRAAPATWSVARRCSMPSASSVRH